MSPRARALYRRFEALVAACGPYHLAPAKTRLAFLARVRFAALTRVSDDGITISFALPRPVRSSSLLRVTEIVPGWWVHTLRVTEPRQLDARLQAWIRRSYDLMGMQGRLRLRRGSGRRSSVS
jgi:hypothetical protein